MSRSIATCRRANRSRFPASTIARALLERGLASLASPVIRREYRGAAAMKPTFSIIFFTVISGAGLGLLVAARAGGRVPGATPCREPRSSPASRWRWR